MADALHLLVNQRSINETSTIAWYAWFIKIDVPKRKDTQVTAIRGIWKRQIGLVAAIVGMVVALFANPQFSYAQQQYMLSAASVQNQTTQVGTAFTDPMMVLVCEAYSNPCKAVKDIEVTFTAPSSGASGTFATTGTNTATARSGATGIATAPAFAANSSLGSYSVRVTAAEPTPSDAVPNFFFFTNSANAADRATLISMGNGSNQTVEINTVFPTRLAVAVFNGHNQLLPGVKVTFSAPSSGASGTFSDTGKSTTTAVTGATGLATAATFKANGVDGAYTVTATVDGSQTTSGGAISTPFALKNSIANVNGVPDMISLAAGSGQQGWLFTPFPTNLQVAIFDGSLRYVPGVTVTFTAPSSGASGTFAGGSITYITTTGTTGLASAPTFTANGITGAYTIAVSASKNGVTINGAMNLSNALVKTTTAVTLNPGTRSVYGQPIKLSAKVQPVASSYIPSGAVSFQRDGVDIAGCVRLAPSNGLATCTLNSSADKSTWLVPGSYSFSAAYDGDANSQPSSTSVAYTVDKAIPLVFQNANSVQFELGMFKGFAISARGSRMPTVRLMSGTLPKGLSLDTSNVGVMGVFGTPDNGTAGSYPLVFTASDGVSPDVTQNFTLTVREAPHITSSSVVTFTAGITNRFTFTANSDPTPQFKIVENMYGGFSLTPDGRFVGTPDSDFKFTVTVVATNGIQRDATQSFTVIIVKADQTPLVVSTTSQSGIPGDLLPLSVSGGSGYGAVTFDVGTSTACQMHTFDTLVVTKGVGTCQVRATKIGDNIYNNATSAPITITVSRLDQRPLVLSTPIQSGMPGMIVPLNIMGGSGYGSVSFDVGSSTACKVGNMNTLLITNSVGTCQVTATKAGDDSYNSVTSAPISIEVKAS